MTFQLGIVGCGVMGEAILSHLLTKGSYAPTEICVSDPQAERLRFVEQKYAVAVTSSNAEVANSQVVILAVKPQVFAVIADQIARGTASIVISILAGTTLARLESTLPNRAAIRAMPNTPAQVGAGITALVAGTLASPQHMAIARRIFGAVGEVVEVSESLIDAVTGLSGSGPAYVALAIEALADGGVAAGLSRDIAYRLAIQTVLGTANLLSSTGLHPGQLKDRVASPGGTTIAGVVQLEKCGVRSAFIEAVLAATRRAEELGKLS